MPLISEYKASLKNIAVEEYVDLLFFRPLAFILVKSIYRTSLSPNHITMISVFVGAISGILFGMGTSTTIMFGGMCIAVATILDCADGQLARLKKNGTPFGRILDGVADYLYTISAFVGIALGGRSEQVGLVFWWILVSTAGISYAIQAGLLDFYRNEYLTRLAGGGNFVEDELETFTRDYERVKGAKGHYLEKFLLIVYIRYSSYQARLQSKDTPEPKAMIKPSDRNNSLLIRLWSLNGTSTHLFFLMCSAFFGRLDYFLWYILIFGSAYSSLLYTIQKIADKKAAS